MGDPALLPPRIERTIPVADDRVLGIAEFGPADGRTILWFHGTPGGCRQVRDAKIAMNMGWASPATGSALILASARA